MPASQFQTKRKDAAGRIRPCSFEYHTTNKARALAVVAKLLAAGYSHLKTKPARFAPLPEMTFTTRTYSSPGAKPVHAMSWAYSQHAPLPPRRKLGRAACSECGKRREHTRGLCAACRFRQRYHSDAEFRERHLEKARKKMAQLASLPEWRKKRAEYRLRWAKAKRDKARAERAAA